MPTMIPPAMMSAALTCGDILSVLLPRSMDDNLGRDLNLLFGFADTPVHQRIRSLEAHLFRVGAGDERFKLGDRTWCQVPQA